MARVFISYRRDDSAGYAGRLFDRLSARFGEANVFMDVDSIEPGQDFIASIQRSVTGCDALVAVIGPDWLTIARPDGRRRLDDPADMVRVEVESALSARGIEVFPALVEGASMPRAADLPAPMRPLTRRQAVEISDSRFRFDSNRLIAAIEEGVRSQERARLLELVRGHPRGSAVVGVMAAIGITFAALAATGALSGNSQAPPGESRPPPRVDAAYFTLTPPSEGGLATLSTTARVSELYVHFHFAVRPRGAARITVQWYAPGGHPLKSVRKPNLPTVDAFIRASGRWLKQGRWQAVLRVGQDEIKRTTMTIDAPAPSGSSGVPPAGATPPPPNP
jgi:hypothetical protein